MMFGMGIGYVWLVVGVMFKLFSDVFVVLVKMIIVLIVFCMIVLGIMLLLNG